MGYERGDRIYLDNVLITNGCNVHLTNENIGYVLNGHYTIIGILNYDDGPFYFIDDNYGTVFSSSGDFTTIQEVRNRKIDIIKNKINK